MSYMGMGQWSLVIGHWSFVTGHLSFGSHWSFGTGLWLRLRWRRRGDRRLPRADREAPAGLQRSSAGGFHRGRVLIRRHRVLEINGLGKAEPTLAGGRGGGERKQAGAKVIAQ